MRLRQYFIAGLLLLLLGGCHAYAITDPSMRPISIRAIEAGEDGVLHRGAPPLLDLELTTEVPFEGVLTGWIVAGQEGNVERVTMPVHADAGTTRLSLPFLGAAPWGAADASAIMWELRDDDGALASAASVPVRVSDDRGPLFLTGAPGAGMRRDPARLDRRAHRLLGHDVLVVSGADVASLSSDGIDALLDAVSLGAVLVIIAPDAPLPKVLDDLAAGSVLAWREIAGRSLRECRYGRGHVRFTDLALEDLVAREPSLPAGLALYGEPIVARPAGLAGGAVSRWGVGSASSSRLMPSFAPLNPEFRAASAMGAALVLNVLLIIALVLLARRPSLRHGARRAIAALSVLALAVPLEAALLAKWALEWETRDTLITVHGSSGETAVRHRLQRAARWGGFVPPKASMDEGSAVIVRNRLPEMMLADERPKALVSTLGDGRRDVEAATLARLGPMISPQVDVMSSERVGSSPPMEAALSWDGDRLLAKLTAREDVDDALFFAGSNVARFGPVRRGEMLSLDVSALSRPGEGGARIDWRGTLACAEALDPWSPGSPWDAGDALALVTLRGMHPIAADVQPVPMPRIAAADASYLIAGGRATLGPGSAEAPSVTIDIPATSGLCDGAEGSLWIFVTRERIVGLVGDVMEDEAGDTCHLVIRDPQFRSRRVPTEVRVLPARITWRPRAPEATP